MIGMIAMIIAVMIISEVAGIPSRFSIHNPSSLLSGAVRTP